MHGDDRSLYLKDKFSKKGHLVDYISDLSAIRYDTVYDIAVLPIPLLDIDPYYNILKHSNIKKVIYASTDVNIIKAMDSCQAVNLFDDEDLIFFYARLTAEAALAIAIGNGKRSIYGSKCLVSGYGRIGILLVNLLRAMGAFVVVATGSLSHRKVLTAMDVGYILYDSLNCSLNNYDFIFNTVPDHIFNPDILTDYTGIYYELASKPYGFDYEQTGFGENRILCSRLPGKYFPHSAALGIYEAIIKCT